MTNGGNKTLRKTGRTTKKLLEKVMLTTNIADLRAHTIVLEPIFSKLAN